MMMKKMYSRPVTLLEVKVEIERSLLAGSQLIDFPEVETTGQSVEELDPYFPSGFSFEWE